jgi:leader peptidase (prepilin peptidase)/N-methyltransferase
LSDTYALAAVLFVFGTILGSFANVLIYRMPRGENIAWPGSHCQKCKKPIAWYHNIPVLAWFFLRGKCANCKEPYSFRYPVVELLMGVLFASAAISIGINWTLLEGLIFIFALVAASFIDIDHMILPDKFTLSGIVIGLIGAALNPERSFLDAIYGVLMGGGFLWAIAYLFFVFRGKEGMGGGDIKLLAWIGAVLGWKSIPFVVIGSSVFGAIIGVVIAVRSKEGMSKAIPFGPYLAGAALAYLLLGGERLSDWYLGLHGL